MSTLIHQGEYVDNHALLRFPEIWRVHEEPGNRVAARGVCLWHCPVRHLIPKGERNGDNQG
ncbi:MAG: hypothetical protein APR55_06655 [Methanolinea sp. SDB]|nr:MAG: hypothetical protein APR55_06655 [Methanolinea sp. SDB]